MKRIWRMLVPVVLVLLFLSIIPAVSANVILISGTDEAVLPGEEVEYKFVVRNSDKISETVSVTVITRYDSTITADNFQLSFQGEQEVDVTVTVPSDTPPEDVDEVVIYFEEQGPVQVDDTTFHFIIYVYEEEIDEEDGYNRTPHEEASDDPIEEAQEFAEGFIGYYIIFLIILIICMAIFVQFVKSRMLIREEDKKWASDLSDKEMKALQKGRADPKTKYVWTFEWIEGGLMFAAIFWACFVMFDFFFFPQMPLVTIVTLSLLIPYLAVALVYGTFYHASYSFTVKNDKIIVRRGIITRIKAEVPYERIQNVHTVAGFWDRIFGVNSIRVDTAGSPVAEAMIQGLNNPEPVVKYILRRAKEAKIKNGL